MQHKRLTDVQSLHHIEASRDEEIITRQFYYSAFRLHFQGILTIDGISMSLPWTRPAGCCGSRKLFAWQRSCFITRHRLARIEVTAPQKSAMKNQDEMASSFVHDTLAIEDAEMFSEQVSTYLAICWPNVLQSESVSGYVTSACFGC